MLPKVNALTPLATSDWAIDLQEQWADTHNVDSNTDDDEEDLEVIEWCDKEYNSIEAILSSTPVTVLPRKF